MRFCRLRRARPEGDSVAYAVDGEAEGDAGDCGYSSAKEGQISLCNDGVV